MLVEPKNVHGSDFFVYVKSLFKEVGLTCLEERSTAKETGSLGGGALFKGLLRQFAKVLNASFWCPSLNRVYCFPEAICLVDAIYSKIVGRTVYVYIHEPSITKKRLSSYLKQVVQDLICLLTVNIGVQEGDYLRLLFARKNQHKARAIKLGSKPRILFFGNWIRGKVNPECIQQALDLFRGRYTLTRAGNSYSGEFNKYFDELYDGFVTDESKEKLYQGADFLFLPYHPTAQSGVYADALAYGLPVVCSDRVYDDLHGQLHNLYSASNLADVDQKTAHQQAVQCWQKTHMENLNYVRRLMLG